MVTKINLPPLLRKQDTIAPGFNVDSLVSLLPLSSEFDPLPRLERLSQLKAISDVTESRLSTQLA
ncbi:hypothetical protein HF325_001668 [Metschnikowia pulcherrima]|uniref:Uncharacterized protein n=1 Tax=Metschnikowia pulcherrima TaxID=27326 RepID=A0A8H7GUY4_9ASCO|nr:hypothetical protein HF325_001668 [Metschnikowia pulcherrima]